MIGVFGGTFDPVHVGHLRAMVELRDALALDELRAVPCARPVHRDAPAAPPAARIAMLEAALADMARCTVDDREIRRGGPSYMIDTLESLRAEIPDRALCLLLGRDAYAGLAGWKRWRELFELAHVVVAARPGVAVEPPPELAAEVTPRRVDDATALRGSRAGCVLFCATTELDVSARAIRALAASGKSLQWLVPRAVARMIETNAWYTEVRNG